MKKLGILVALALAPAGLAHAADAPATCVNISDFFTTSCPLSGGGLTLYGTIDMGVMSQTHGVPFNGDFPNGVTELINKISNKSRTGLAPNGLSQSVIGVRGNIPAIDGWNVVFQAETGFDPMSLQLADGPRSLEHANGVSGLNQSSNGDSSRAGQPFNSQLFAGVSNPTFGTLTVGRMNTLTLDGVNAYDPMGGSYAFSVIGTSGATAGTGNTEDSRVNTGIKYRVNVGPLRAGLIYQVGDYEQGNGATEVFQAQVGGDYEPGGIGKFSADAIFSHLTNAVSLSALSAAQDAKYPGTLAATISDNTGEMLLAKYALGPVSVMGGYELIHFANPSEAQTGFHSLSGIPVVTADITNTSYTHQKTLQVMWLGGRYAVTSQINVGAAYYHYIQGSYNTAYCSNNSSSKCAGTLDAYSMDVDYQVLPKLDTYAGVMFSQVNGGLSNGYLFRRTADPMVGARFRF